MKTHKPQAMDIDELTKRIHEIARQADESTTARQLLQNIVLSLIGKSDAPQKKNTNSCPVKGVPISAYVRYF